MEEKVMYQSYEVQHELRGIANKINLKRVQLITDYIWKHEIL